MSSIIEESLRLTLVSHAATAAMRRGQLPDGDDLDRRGVDAVQSWPGRSLLPKTPSVFVSPVPCAISTARALGLDGRQEEALAEMDFGRWRGCQFKDLAESQPAALQDWLSNADMDSHGGESFSRLSQRVSSWMDSLSAKDEVVAITHASVIRAAIIHALGCPVSSFRHIEISPLAMVRLVRSRRGWIWSPSSS